MSSRTLATLLALGLAAPTGSMRSAPRPAFVHAAVSSAPLAAASCSPARSRTHMIASIDSSRNVADRGAALDEGYEVCRKITANYAKTFYLGTRFMEPSRARAIWAVYAWCRRTDDIVDAPRGGIKYLKQEIATWSERLEGIWEGEAYDVVDLPLVETVKQYPTMSIQPYKDMIEGMLMDLKQDRYESFDDLYLYCYRVAGTVGLMTLPVMGTAEGVTYDEAVEPVRPRPRARRAPGERLGSSGGARPAHASRRAASRPPRVQALALGIALQLTNILRDVGEDARRGRIYLPKDELARFGVTEEQILAGVLDERYVRLMQFQIGRARDYFDKSEDGIPKLSESARMCEAPRRSPPQLARTAHTAGPAARIGHRAHAAPSAFPLLAPSSAALRPSRLPAGLCARAWTCTERSSNGLRPTAMTTSGSAPT